MLTIQDRATRRSRSESIIFSIVFMLSLTIVSLGQTTEFTYQGSLKDGASTATGNYDFEFRLYDLPTGGSQIGASNTRSAVTVAAGIFSVNLDFGPGFPGGDRYLEIGVRTAGGGAFTVLSPRQRIASSPYSIKSLNAATADNATNAENATNAATATSFTGALNGDVTGTQSATTVARLQNRNVASTAPTDGQVLKYNAATSQWRPDTDNAGSGGGGGTITGVTAGTGLTGGGTTGTVAVSIANSGVGTAQIADNNVTDPKINSVSGAKVTGPVATATNSTQLGGIAANQFVQTGDPRLSDARSPTAGSGNYVQNTTSPQATSNFNISGTGRADIFNAATQYNLGGSRVLSANGSQNLFLGNAGASVTSGFGNSFFGQAAGVSTTSGSYNAFFGTGAGRENTTGIENSFFGVFAGDSNTGSQNSFFGFGAGRNNTAGGNTFYGFYAGVDNTTGTGNAFFGTNAGNNNGAASGNSYFGYESGFNATGVRNSYFGNNTGQATSAGNDNTLVGYVAGDSTTSSDNTLIGSDAGGATTSGGENTFVGSDAGDANTTGSNNTALGRSANFSAGNLTFATAIGASSSVSASNTIALGRSNGSDRVRVYGNLAINTLAAGTSTNLCINVLTETVASCSSSLRYKHNIASLHTGLDLIKRFRPVTFSWTESNEADLGLIAEEVAEVEPLLATYNKNGEIQGVKYDRISIVLLNAVKEQQEQIEALQEELRQLKKLLCGANKKTGVCNKSRELVISRPVGRK